VAFGLLLLTAAVAYTAYLLLANPGSRSDVRPQHALGLVRPLIWYPSTLLAAVWRGLVGGFAHQLAELPATITASPRAGLFGLLLAALLLMGSTPSSHPRTLPGRGTWLALLVALAAGLAPVVLMGRVPWDPADGMTSRYGISVLPILAALVVRTALALTNARWRAVPVILLGLVAGVTAMAEVGTAVEERQLVGRLGAALQPRVAETSGHTIAAVSLPERPIGPRRQWELVARLATDWPPEQRERLWAYRYGGGPALSYKEEATRVLGTRDRCRPPQRIGKRVRLVERQGPVAQVLWMAPGRRQRVVIEPYCLSVR
jgi:protein-S-isoprenylcysteine O-methyltransferase Ste14